MSTGLLKDVTPPILLATIVGLIYSIVQYKYFYSPPADLTPIEKMPIFQVLVGWRCLVNDIFAAIAMVLPLIAIWKYFYKYKMYSS